MFRNLAIMSGEWLRFRNNEFSSESRKEFRKRLSELQPKIIKNPEALDTDEFTTLHEGIAMQNLNQLCLVSYFDVESGRTLSSQAWSRLFGIQEPVVRDYELEFLASVTFRDRVEVLDEPDTLVFQLGGARRTMTVREFILAMGLYTQLEMNNNLFEPFYDSLLRHRPVNYDPTLYLTQISTQANYETRHPPSYKTIRTPLRRLVHHLLTFTIAGRHSGKEKVTMDDLYLFHSMDGGALVDVPWHVAKFLFDKAKGAKKRSPICGAHLIQRLARHFGLMTAEALSDMDVGVGTSLMGLHKLVDLEICRYNALGYGELVPEILEASDEEGQAAEAAVGGAGRNPNMSTGNRLRAIDERIGDVEDRIYRMADDVEDLTYVINGVSSQYDQFYGEFGKWRGEQERYHTWGTDHLSMLLQHHHIDHTRFDGTPYTYVLDIPDIGVQQCVNFMSGTPDFSIAPYPFHSQADPSTFHRDDLNED